MMSMMAVLMCAAAPRFAHADAGGAGRNFCQQVLELRDLCLESPELKAWQSCRDRIWSRHPKRLRDEDANTIEREVDTTCGEQPCLLFEHIVNGECSSILKPTKNIE
jgi:phage/plasmid primase-like uncharacterized protein